MHHKMIQPEKPAGYHRNGKNTTPVTLIKWEVKLNTINKISYSL